MRKAPTNEVMITAPTMAARHSFRDYPILLLERARHNHDIGHPGLGSLGIKGCQVLAPGLGGWAGRKRSHQPGHRWEDRRHPAQHRSLSGL